MKVLLDTHAFLWWIMDDPRLSATARAIIADPDTVVHVSAACAWEIAIKTSLEKLRLPQSPSSYIPAQMQINGFNELAITVDHALHIHALPHHHRDPFDRILVAQSQMEGIPLVSRDPLLGHYAVDLIW